MTVIFAEQLPVVSCVDKNSQQSLGLHLQMHLNLQTAGVHANCVVGKLGLLDGFWFQILHV
jgi:hypothetical protein